MQLARLVGHRFGEVFCFAEIVSEVVKLQTAVFEEFHQLPVADFDQADRSRAPEARSRAKITREALIDGVTLQLGGAIAEEGDETFTVQPLTSRQFRARRTG